MYIHLKFSEVPVLCLDALAGVDERDVPLVLLDLLVQLPDVCAVLGELHGVQVPQLRDRLQLLQQPQHRVQVEFRRLEKL